MSTGIMTSDHPKNDDPKAEFLVPRSIEKVIRSIYYDIIIEIQKRKNVSVWIDGLNNWGITRNNKILSDEKIKKNDTLFALSNVMESKISARGFDLHVFQWIALFIQDEKWRQAHGYYNCKEHGGMY